MGRFLAVAREDLQKTSGTGGHLSATGALAFCFTSED
jgi:hypothetical protein